MKRYVLGSTVDELKAWFKNASEQPFRAQQLIEWVYKKKEINFDRMTNMSEALRAKLQSEFEIGEMKLRSSQDSSDGQTHKFLWELDDGKLVESVLIIAPGRHTVCVSSQVGCPARCAFCASGKKGFFRNLSAREIVAQIYYIDRFLQEKGEKVTHIVYMGMGEPFRNYDEVVKSISLLIHPDFFGFSQRRITVSTVGVIEGIHRFADEDFKVNLVLSLHAPNQRLRQKIIPYAREYPLDEILLAMDSYAKKTKRDITFEYTLIHGINDQEEQAKELISLLKGKQCTVNLIPYNPVEGLTLKRPDGASVKRFREILTQGRILNTCRYTKGDDIAAACGQLALQESTTPSVLKVLN